MTRLSVYREDDSSRPELQTTDWLIVSAHLAHAGILFERWEAEVPLVADSDSEAVLAAYAGSVARLKAGRGFQSADVVRVGKETPNLPTVRGKFLDEHTHVEDEARFFVEGSGAFYLHVKDRVFIVVCERGDLISLPAGLRHWFDMGESPCFTAIRFFTRPDGWVASFTGDGIARRFPAYEP